MGAATQNRFTRRTAVSLLSVTAVGGVFLPRRSWSAGVDASLLMPDAGMCIITPETTEGPFYFDPELVRSDITDGRPGVPLTVRLQVVDASCQPIVGAAVDIWHCDAQGLYSGYPGQGDRRDIDTSAEKFLRGVQRTSPEGIVSFRTIYPGWYRGRTTHVHFKVFIEERTLLTGQLFFPDALSDHVFTTVAPYNRRDVGRDATNQSDRIARDAGPTSQAALRETMSSLEALMIIAVNPA